MNIKVSNNQDLLDIKCGNKQILAVYSLGQKLWSNISASCYYNGYWIDEYPWTDDTSWMD